MSTPLGKAIQKFDIVKYCDENGISHKEEPNGDIRIEYAEGHTSLLWWTGRASSHWMSNQQGFVNFVPKLHKFSRKIAHPVS
jgi:hypothetical protein